MGPGGLTRLKYASMAATSRARTGGACAIAVSVASSPPKYWSTIPAARMTRVRASLTALVRASSYCRQASAPATHTKRMPASSVPRSTRRRNGLVLPSTVSSTGAAGRSAGNVSACKGLVLRPGSRLPRLHCLDALGTTRRLANAALHERRRRVAPRTPSQHTHDKPLPGRSTSGDVPRSSHRRCRPGT
jgi:hypothetical protein